MRRPSRLRRIAKWAGLILLALLIPTYVGSFWNGVSYVQPVMNNTAVVAIYGGSVELGWILMRTSADFNVWNVAVFHWLPDYDNVGRAGHSLLIPLWMLLAVLAPLTAFLWHFDRRRIPPGHCKKCGYVLTGNISGRCPECGKKV